MLETPLYGRFVGERRLSFLAPLPYLLLVRACYIGGALCILNGLFFLYQAFIPAWWQMLGVMLVGAGVLASLSLHSVIFDLREKSYRRRQGPGTFPKLTRGSTNDLDAIVLVAEPRSFPSAAVTYHLVLHWKGQREPLMILQQDTRAMGPGIPLNAASGQIAAVGHRYAKALGLPFYDNSHIPAPCPRPIW